MRVFLAVALCFAMLFGVGCGSSDSGETATDTQAAKLDRQRKQAKRRAAQRRAALRHQARLRARRVHLAALRRRQARERQVEAEAAEAIAAEAPEEEAVSSCDPNYTGACLDPTASDYDCEGGSGDGPYYTGEVTVVGSDPHGLDSDSDGIGCEIE